MHFVIRKILGLFLNIWAYKKIILYVLVCVYYCKSCVYLRVIGQCKKPTAQTAHLVFADTKAKAKKTKRAVFCQRSTEIENELNK